MRRALRFLLAATSAAVLVGAMTSSSSASTGLANHGMRVRDAHHHGGGGGSNLFSHGGPVEVTPAVYISWWGSEWSGGFSTGGYSSGQLQTYETGFFGSVGGSSWINSTSQYCQGVPSGTIFCGSSGTHISNPTGQLKGDWNDTTSVPSSPSQSDIAAAAVRLVQHFGYDSNATYFVFTPSGKSMRGFGTQWCAWHSSTSSTSGTVAYAYMPYVTDAGANCGANFVNPTNDSYGNGYFDGFSIVGGHEYAEAQTDPQPNSGWVDGSGAENGDKCAWSSASTNISLGGHQYAVQPLWSNLANNSAGGCVVSF